MSAERLEILPRSFVEHIAGVLGPASAAARALECADGGEHGNDPVFGRPLGRHNDHLIVTSAENLVPDESGLEQETRA